MYLNKVLLFGNLTRDPEIRALSSGAQVANFALATNRVYKDKNGAKQEATEFHNIVAFGRQAEVIGQYCKKGKAIYVEGRLQTRSWDDKGSGQKKYRTEIVLENFQFGDSKGGGGGSASSPRAPEDVSQEAPKGEGEEIKYPDEEINPEDIPF
jgi:single-strand DNA-binding protein